MFRALAEKIIGYPDELKTVTVIEGRTVTTRARVHSDDQGKMLGAKRKTLNAMNVVLKTAAERYGLAANYILLEPNVGTRQSFSGFNAAANWNSETIVTLLRMTVEAMLGEPVTITAKDEGGTKPKTDITLEYRGQHISDEQEFAIDDAVGHLFHAIGKAMGRHVYITTKKTA